MSQMDDCVADAFKSGPEGLAAGAQISLRRCICRICACIPPPSPTPPMESNLGPAPQGAPYALTGCGGVSRSIQAGPAETSIRSETAGRKPSQRPLPLCGSRRLQARPAQPGARAAQIRLMAHQAERRQPGRGGLRPSQGATNRIEGIGLRCQVQRVLLQAGAKPPARARSAVSLRASRGLERI